MVGERDHMDRLIDRAEAQEEVLFRLFDLLDEADLAGFPEHLYWELYAVRDRMVEDYKVRFPGCGQGRSISLKDD